jgi:16S rRNA pseudouridine516 synthase
MLIRLDKIITNDGRFTRSEARELLRAGRVTIDGAAVRDGAVKLPPGTACIFVDGERLTWHRFHYYMMNKPPGVVTSTDDPRERTVLDLLPPEMRRLGLFPAGRLDKDSVGLLLLTDDGELAHRLMSPKHKADKLYFVRVDGVLDDSDAAAFTEGLLLRDGLHTLPAELRILSPSEAEVTLREGKYHQVKRMLASRGKPVTYLKRLRIGALKLDPNLGEGLWRELTETEIIVLKGMLT